VLLAGRAACIFVSRIHVTSYTDAGIVRKHSVQSARTVFRAIRHRHLPGVKRIPYADSTAVVN
jgi:hypothetical protein